MPVLKFVKSRQFVRHLLIAAALGIVLLWVAMKMLDIYTLHGKTIEVPELVGLQQQEVARLLNTIDLRYMINDSVFDDRLPKGSVFAQDPAPGIQVKKNRTIYLTTVAIMPEMVAVPDLTDLSLRQAITMLQNFGLRAGNLEYRPDIARNAVLQQKFMGGVIEAGTLVEMGTAIDLVLGEGLGREEVMVPVLVGIERHEAISTLQSASLNVGHEVFLDEDDGQLRVYLQFPDPLNKRQYLQAGSSVDLHYRSAREFNFEEYLASVMTVPVPMLFGKTPEEARATILDLGMEVGEEVFEQQVSDRDARVFRQEPEYSPDTLIRKDTRIHLWYRPVEALDTDIDL